MIQNNAIPKNSLPPAIKSDLAQLPWPHKNEANALKKLARTLFGSVFRNIFSKPRGFKAGFVCAVLQHLDHVLKDIDLSADEREALYALAIPILGFGHQVNEASIRKLQELIALGRLVYDSAQQLPDELRDNFYEGFKRGSKIATLGNRILDVGADSTKVHIVIAVLGAHNRVMRSTRDLFDFIEKVASFKFQFDWDSFKKVCQDVSWHGAKFLRSTRSKNSGVSLRPATP